MKNLVMKNNHRNQKQVQLHNEQLHAHKLEKLSSNLRHNQGLKTRGAAKVSSSRMGTVTHIASSSSL